MFKKICFLLLVLCLAIICLFTYNRFHKINNFFNVSILENNNYHGVIMNDYETIEGSFTLECERLNNYKKGVIYKLELNNIDTMHQGNADSFLLGYFYVCEDRIVKMDNQLQEVDVVCQEESIKDTLGKDEKGWHSSLNYNGEECSYKSYNNQVETGFYESIIWKKKEGLIYYRRGFGAGSNSVEISLQ